MATGYTCKHGNTFDPAKASCFECDTSAPEPETPVLGEGELLCAEAQRRGLPDGFDVEERIVEAWRIAGDRSLKCAGVADDLLQAGDENAIRWEMAAAKWADTAIKAAKIVAGTVQVRERIAAADRADRVQAAAERAH